MGTATIGQIIGRVGRYRAVMAFNSRYAFHALVSLLRPAVICDVGSCDGTQAVRFKRQVRSARVIAFEANPDNAARIAARPDVRHLGIDLRPMAVSDAEGTVTFFVLEQRGDLPWSVGASSLNRRAEGEDHGLRQTPVEVQTTTLDRALSGTSGSVALWIDVEGAAGLVIAGIREIASRVCAIHIETEEDLVQIWDCQSSTGSVVQALGLLGFRVLGSDQDWPGQRNIVLVRADGSRLNRVAVAAAVRLAVIYTVLRPVRAA